MGTNSQRQHQLDNNGGGGGQTRRSKLATNQQSGSYHNPGTVSEGILWNGRIEVPLKINSEKRNGNTYLATKQIIY